MQALTIMLGVGFVGIVLGVGFVGTAVTVYLVVGVTIVLPGSGGTACAGFSSSSRAVPAPPR